MFHVKQFLFFYYDVSRETSYILSSFIVGFGRFLNFKRRCILTNTPSSNVSRETFLFYRLFCRKSCFTWKLLPSIFYFFNFYKRSTDITSWKHKFYNFFLFSTKYFDCCLCFLHFFIYFTRFIWNE